MSKTKHTKVSKQVNTQIITDNRQSSLSMRRAWSVIPYLIGIVALLYYVNSISGAYVMDDAIVISENQYTVQGFKGLKGIFGHDTFYGFFKEEGKGHLVEGGRYRPLSLALFAVEGQIFGFYPIVFHVMNILYFALTCMLLFYVIKNLMRRRLGEERALIIAFFSALIFAIHPIHTEVVANIKGRDEIMACMLGLLGMMQYLKSIETNKLLPSILASCFWFLALLSKENGIVFIALTPLAAWFFYDASIRKLLKTMALPILMVIAYLVIRYAVLGSAPKAGPIMELMNNPFLYWETNGYLPVSLSIKMATIAVTMLKYIALLCFPHPLTSDYYPKQIALATWSDWKAILGMLLYVAAIIICIVRFKRKEVVVYGILFYLIALFPMSNIPFPVGTLMSERFLFIPSIGFVLIVSWLIDRYIVKGSLNYRINLVLVAIILILGIKTVARNKDWSDNYTLFTTDVQVSDKSAKMLNAAGGVLLDSSVHVEKPEVKREMVERAQQYLLKAIEIHPAYANAYLLLGNSYVYQNNYEKALEYYQFALKYNPDFRDARSNMAKMYKEMGRKAGEVEGNLPKAKEMLQKSLEIDAKDPETNRLMGVATGMSGQAREAIKYFQAALDAKPDDAFYMFDLGSAYANVGDMEKANYYHSEAIRKDPSLQKRLNK